MLLKLFGEKLNCSTVKQKRYSLIAKKCVGGRGRVWTDQHIIAKRCVRGRGPRPDFVRIYHIKNDAKLNIILPVNPT